VCAVVIAHRYAAPVLEFGEHVLDLVTLFIKRPVVFDWLLAVLPRRYAGRDALGRQGFSEAVAIVASVADRRRR